MSFIEIINQYYSIMTSILKIFIIYIISNWYGFSFAFPFIFFFIRIYQIIINKIYNIYPLSLNEQLKILKCIFKDKINIKEINLKNTNIKKEDIIKKIKEYINNVYILKRRLIYKLHNYYWAELNEKEIIKNISETEKKKDNKIKILKEIPYKIYVIENSSGINDNALKLVFQFNSLFHEKNFESLIDYLQDDNKDNNSKKKKNKNKLIKICLDFISFPFQIILEILLLLFLSTK